MVERLTSVALASAAMDNPGLACIAAMSLRSAVFAVDRTGRGGSCRLAASRDRGDGDAIGGGSRSFPLGGCGSWPLGFAAGASQRAISSSTAGGHVSNVAHGGVQRDEILSIHRRAPSLIAGQPASPPNTAWARRSPPSGLAVKLNCRIRRSALRDQTQLRGQLVGFGPWHFLVGAVQ